MAEMEKAGSPNRKVNIERIDKIDEQVSELLTEKAILRNLIADEIVAEIEAIKATISQLRKNVTELLKMKAQVIAFKLSTLAEKLLKKKSE